jgi:hypothetical protein
VASSSRSAPDVKRDAVKLLDVPAAAATAT